VRDKSGARSNPSQPLNPSIREEFPAPVSDPKGQIISAPLHNYRLGHPVIGRVRRPTRHKEPLGRNRWGASLNITIPLLICYQTTADSGSPLTMETEETRDIEAAADVVERAPSSPATAEGKASSSGKPLPAVKLVRRATMQDVALPDDESGAHGFSRRAMTWVTRPQPRVRRAPREIIHSSLEAARRRLPLPLGIGEAGIAKTQSNQAHAADAEEELKLELLHRYNILSFRSRLLRLLQGEMELTGEGTVEHINQELDLYCRFFLSDPLCVRRGDDD